jgi:chromosome segregation ATPase
MESLPMDEATKFKAAFATLQSFGCELDQLLESFDYYNGILDGERDKFDEALRATVGEDVVDKEKQVKRLTDENLASSAEIQKLTAEIEANRQAIARLQQQLAEINGKLKRQEDSFTAAFNEVKERLRSDAAKITTYLGPVVAAQSTGNSRKK